jgi:hypothetical protein
MLLVHACHELPYLISLRHSAAVLKIHEFASLWMRVYPVRAILPLESEAERFRQPAKLPERET